MPRRIKAFRRPLTAQKTGHRIQYSQAKIMLGREHTPTTSIQNLILSDCPSDVNRVHDGVVSREPDRVTTSLRLAKATDARQMSLRAPRAGCGDAFKGDVNKRVGCIRHPPSFLSK
jgi:hypothetical protein